MPTIELRVVSGSQVGALLPLAEGKFLIGREHDCHLRPNSELVSRHHCAFTRDAFAVRLRDLGSTNGTFVNGERVRGTAVLKPGDRVVVGKLELELVVDGQPGAPAEETLHAHRDDTIVAGKPAQTVPQGDSGFDVSMMGDALSQLDDETAAVAAAAPPTNSGTVVIPAPETQELAAAAAGVPAGMPGYPPNPWAGQPQYPYPGMYPQYPGMPGMPYGYGYPYPNMPPMPQMPPGYGYPQAMPQQPMPAQPTPEAAPEQQSAEAFPEFNLPDPKTTGAKAPAAPPPPKADDPSKPKAHIPSAAQDIINSYLNRRPKT
jgi:predicted component of type VI protein secretion system